MALWTRYAITIAYDVSAVIRPVYGGFETQVINWSFTQPLLVIINLILSYIQCLCLEKKLPELTVLTSRIIVTSAGCVQIRDGLHKRKKDGDN